MLNSFQYIHQICDVDSVDVQNRSKCASISPQDTRWYTHIKYPISPNIQHKLERLTRHRVPSTCSEMLPKSVIHTAMSISQSQLRKNWDINLNSFLLRHISCCKTTSFCCSLCPRCYCSCANLSCLRNALRRWKTGSMLWQKWWDLSCTWVL